MTKETALVLSTAHILPGTAKLLKKNAAPDLDIAELKRENAYLDVVVYPKDVFGYVIAVPQEPVLDLPDDLTACLQKAKDEGCQWLMLDRDEEPAESLPIYEWEGVDVYGDD